MNVIILAAGQGTRLRPLTDRQPKCMVEIGGKSIIRHQLDTMQACGIRQEEISVVCGYKQEVLKAHLADTKVNLIYNEAYETTNMVCSLMCAERFLTGETIVSYGDIVYTSGVLKKLLESREALSVVVDDGWYPYWKQRCEDPLSDAETLKFNEKGLIKEIGQKAKSLEEVQSQYIGLMKYSRQGVGFVTALCKEAKRRSLSGEPLWRTQRNYEKMYMTDLLQGLADEGYALYPVRIERGWFEVDNLDDLKLAEEGCKANQ